MAAHEIVH
jgi:hypothetical protein